MEAQTIVCFIKILNFDKNKAQFFSVLVKFNQAENANERKLF